jgi:hypothetical protein
MHIPVEWLLGVLALLASVIGTLAGIIYKSLSSEIASLRAVVAKLQDDIDRLSKGCGIGACIWKNR